MEDELLTKDIATLLRENKELEDKNWDQEYKIEDLEGDLSRVKKDLTSALKSIEALSESYLRLSSKEKIVIEKYPRGDIPLTPPSDFPFTAPYDNNDSIVYNKKVT